MLQHRDSSIERLEEKVDGIDKRLAVIESEVSNHIRSDLAFLRMQVWSLFGIIVAAALAIHYWR